MERRASTSCIASTPSWWLSAFSNASVMSCVPVSACTSSCVRGREGHVIAHMCRLNNWTRSQALADLKRSSDRCWQLQQTSWHLDLQILRGQIEIAGFPTLQIPADRRPELGSSM